MAAGCWRGLLAALRWHFVLIFHTWQLNSNSTLQPLLRISSLLRMFSTTQLSRHFFLLLFEIREVVIASVGVCIHVYSLRLKPYQPTCPCLETLAASTTFTRRCPATIALNVPLALIWKLWPTSSTPGHCALWKPYYKQTITNSLPLARPLLCFTSLFFFRGDLTGTCFLSCSTAKTVLHSLS